MRFVLASVLTLVALACVRGADSTKTQGGNIEGCQANPAFWLRLPSDPGPPGTLQFRENADAMLEINAISLVGDAGVNVDSSIWQDIHSSVAEFVSDAGAHKKIHIRFYHSDYAATRGSIKDLHTEAKRAVADVPIFVVMLDETVRNDRLPWEEYLSRHRILPAETDEQPDARERRSRQQ